jgi:4-amino-4-deoxy-L-arabinose transferase-like glycosyltransferase
MDRLSRARSWLTQRPRVLLFCEALAAASVLAIATVVRIVDLGSVPQLLVGDETNNLKSAYHVIYGSAGGLTGFDWDATAIVGLYPLAWSVRVFGDSVADFRMAGVVASLAMMLAFYAVARRAMSPFAALLALALLGTNLWVLNFSRTGWENIQTALFAVCACGTTMRAIETRRWWWWLAAGVFVTCGFYGHLAGFFIFVGVAVAAGFAAALRAAPWRATAAGLALAAAVSALLFGPMADAYIDNEAFEDRLDNYSVFNAEQPYEGDTDGWVIAAKNVVRVTRGLILQDGSEARALGTGLVHLRYTPSGRAPLDVIGAHLFLGGLVVGAWRWRRTYGWYAFLVPLIVPQIFARGSPDFARATMYAPFYFLFAGVFIDALLELSPRRWATAAIGTVLAAVVGYSAVTNVADYFAWQSQDATQAHRWPAIDSCEFDLWRDIEKTAIAEGAGGGAGFPEQRRELQCSGVVDRILTQNAPTSWFREQEFSSNDPLNNALSARMMVAAGIGWMLVVGAGMFVLRRRAQ